MNTYESILTRRSTRKYLNKPVSKELLEKIIETGRYAPSGGNSQSIEVYKIQSIFLKKVDMYFLIMHLF